MPDSVASGDEGLMTFGSRVSYRGGSRSKNPRIQGVENSRIKTPGISAEGSELAYGLTILEFSNSRILEFCPSLLRQLEIDDRLLARVERTQRLRAARGALRIRLDFVVGVGIELEEMVGAVFL